MRARGRGVRFALATLFAAGAAFAAYSALLAFDAGGGVADDPATAQRVGGGRWSPTGTNANGVPDALSYSTDWGVYLPGGQVAVGDLTGDGRDDLVVFGREETRTALWMFVQAPDASLAPPVVYNGPLDLHPRSLQLADTNEDGRQDIMIFHAVVPGLSTLLSTPGGGFAWRDHEWIDKPVTLPPKLVDADGDGHLDIVAFVELSGYVYQHHATRGHLVVHFGDGQGNFARDRLQLTGGEPINFMAAGDFDGDGDVDLASVPQNTGAITWVRHNDGTGKFTRDLVLPALHQRFAWNIIDGDLNSDGRDDLLLFNGLLGAEFWAYVQAPDGTLPTQPARFAGNWGGSIVAPKVVDLNKDGLADVIYALGNAPQFIYSLQTPWGLETAVNFNVVPNEPRGPGEEEFAIGDLNGDGVPDVAVRIGEAVYVVHGKLTTFAGAGALPGAPTIGAATLEPATASFAVVDQWFNVPVGPPANDGGHPVVGYELYSIPSGGRDLDAGTPALTHRMTGLEDNRTYSFVARAITAAGKGAASAPSPALVLGGVVDRDAAPRLTLSTGANPEGNLASGYAIGFQASLDKPAPVGGVTFSISTSDGSAVAGVDYVARSVTGLRIEAGAYASGPIIVHLLPDLLVEGNETFDVNVAVQAGATLVTPKVTMTIQDDDDHPPRRLLMDDMVVPEGAGTHVIDFPIALSSPATADVVFDVWSDPAYFGPGAQFDPVDRKGVVIPAGQTTASIPITLHGNAIYGGDRMFKLWILNAHGGDVWNSSASAFVVQMEDDSPPSLSIADVSRMEGDSGTSTMRFEARLSGPTDVDVSVNAVAENLSASAGSDYRSLYFAGLRILPGQTSASFDIPIHEDTTPEPDETFQVRLENANHAQIADGIAIATLVNDDIADGIAIDDLDIVEGDDDTSAQFTVRLSQVQDHAVEFDIATAGGTALPGIDYLPAQASLSIPAGQTTATFPVQVLGDEAVELTENIVVELRNVAGATPVRRQGSGRIADDDVPTLTVSGPTVVAEGDSGARTIEYVLRLSEPVSTRVVFDIVGLFGTANFITDYRAEQKFDTYFDPGRTEYRYSVKIFGDVAPEPDETFGFRLSNVRGALALQPDMLAVLEDDDPAAAAPAPAATRRARRPIGAGAREFPPR
jgi:hypothetical protein